MVLQWSFTGVLSAGWCHPTISPSHPFSSCAQSFPASGSFLMSRHFASGGQSIGASASVLPENIEGWFPWGLTGVIALLAGRGGVPADWPGVLLAAEAPGGAGAAPLSTTHRGHLELRCQGSQLRSENSDLKWWVRGLCTRLPVSKWNQTKPTGKEKKVRLYFLTHVLFLFSRYY